MRSRRGLETDGELQNSAILVTSMSCSDTYQSAGSSPASIADAFATTTAMTPPEGRDTNASAIDVLFRHVPVGRVVACIDRGCVRVAAFGGCHSRGSRASG